jgi:hypothetical protein
LFEEKCIVGYLDLFWRAFDDSDFDFLPVILIAHGSELWLVEMSSGTDRIPSIARPRNPVMPMVEFGVCPTLEVAANAWIVPSRLEDAGSGRKLLETAVGEAKSCSFEDRESSIFSMYFRICNFWEGFGCSSWTLVLEDRGRQRQLPGGQFFSPTAQVGSVNHHNGNFLDIIIGY